MLSNKTLDKIKKESKLAYYLFLSFFKLLEKKNIRDLGKLFAEGNEYIQMDWINENTNLKVKKRDDDDKNGSGFDLITEDNLLTINGKIRSNTFSLETTRRKSKKNKNSSQTGHVAYSVGESDIYLFSKPNVEKYDDLDSWEFIAIPENELINPNNPNFLVTNVPKKIIKKYSNCTKETLEKTYLEMLTKTNNY